MNNDRLSGLASAMIALVTVLGAMVACLATVGASKASDKDIDGLTSYVKAEQETAINNINAFEHMRAHALYFKNRSLANMLIEEAANAGSDAEYNALIDRKNELTGVAAELADRFFPAEYLTSDGLYDVKKELEAAWADDVQQVGDLDPNVHFQEADSLRSTSVSLTGALIVYSFSFLFFTLAQVIENRSRIFFLVLGFIALFVGIISVLFIGVPL